MIIYVPPLQRMVCNYAEEWVAENTPMQLSIGKFSLRYPLKVGMHDVEVVSQGDTILLADDVYADVALMPLLRKKVVVRGIELKGVSGHYTMPDSSLSLQANVRNLKLGGGNIKLDTQEIEVEKIALDGARVAMMYVMQPDTAERDTVPIDWDIAVENIELSTIDFSLSMPSVIDTLQVNIPQARIVLGDICLAQQHVAVEQVAIEQGRYRYVACNSFVAEQPVVSSTDTIKAENWCINVGNISLLNNEVSYITSDSLPGRGMDFSHIAANKINLSVSDVYNEGSALQLTLDTLSMQERSGLYIKDGKGSLALSEEGLISVRDFSLHTPFSDICVEADIDMTIVEHNPDAVLDILANAHLSCRDIAYIYPDAEKYYIHDYDRGRIIDALSDMFTVRIELHGDGKDIQVNELDVLQLGVFSFGGEGYIAMPFDKNNRNVAMSYQLKTTDQVSLANYVTDSLMLHRIVMHPINMSMDTRLSGSEVQAIALVEAQSGTVSVDANYDVLQNSYIAHADVRNMPIDKFLPQDSIGLLSAGLQVQGQYLSLDNPLFKFDAHLSVDTLQFKQYQYGDVNVSALVEERQWSLHVESTQQAAKLLVDADGEYQKDFLAARVRADVGMIDLAALQLSQEPFDVSGHVKAEVVLSNIDSIVQADIEIDNMILGLGEHHYQAQSINLLAASDITYSYLDLRTGDMNINLSSDVGLTQLRPGMERLTQLVDTIFQKQRLNMDELHYGLPPFEFTAEVGGNNVLQRYLNSKGMRLGRAQCEVTNDSLFNLSATAQRFELSGMVLDTITLGAYEHDERLNYRIAMGNRPGNMDEFAHVRVEGFLSGNSTRLYCLQQNRKGETGFMFGCKIDFKPNLVQLTFGPKEPIIGYKRWLLNSDNFITYEHAMRNIEADVRLSYAESHLYVSTINRRNKDVNGVHIDMQNIELSDWVVVSPLVTPMSGLLSANVYVDMPPQGIEASGTLDIEDYVYNKHRVGTFHADVDYALAEQGGNNIDASLLRDGKNILDVAVWLDDAQPRNIDGSITIKKLPLEVADAFVPHNMGEFTGMLNSYISLSGTMQSPAVNGYIRFDDASTTFSSIGASLYLDNTDIPIKNSRLSFSQYGVRGANKVPLKIDGTVDFSQLTNIDVNLDFKGQNFQPIHISENRTGIIYGSVYTDVDARVRGTLNNLVVKGDVSLLSGTNATYVMQSNPMLSSVDYSEMVSFVSFADTAMVYDDEKNATRGSNLTANIDIDIDAGVQLGVNLSPDGANRIDLIGGGNLLYTSTALGDNRMTGRYVLTGGFVRYTPPFISQKIFNIVDGSYVSWNGNIAEPMFNIEAIQSQRSSVKSGEDSRLVDFEVSIKLSNTLKDLDISFDLATTDDLVIENELQGLTAEQREAKAMNMFLYNSYDDLATAAENSLINNPLNTFLEYELNTWAQRTLRGVDLTFGIDNYGVDGTGTQRTDYSYQFSKSLLDNRLKVAVGGSYASNQDVTQNLKENLIDDISLEYRITKRDNMYIKVFRQTGYESIIEGEITQTGAGFLYRKQVGSLLDLFRKKSKNVPNSTPQQPDTIVNVPIEQRQGVKEVTE